MVNKVKALFRKEISGLHEAAYLLAGFAIVSQLFALFRDRMLAGYFGTGIELDVYYAAFKLPDLIFALLCALVSVSVLVPLFIKKIDDKESFQKTINSIFSVLFFFCLIFLVIAFYFTPKFLEWVVPGLFKSQMGGDLVFITRVLLFQPLILSVSGFVSSLVQTYKKFAVYSLSPILYNLGIIIGIYFLSPSVGVYGVVYGVMIGAVLHLICQIPFISEKGLRPKLTLDIDFKEVYSVVINSIPRTVTVISNQGTLIFMTFLASGMVSGSLSTFTFSMNLVTVPLSIIGISYSVAAFPVLSKFFHENKMQEFYENISNAFRHIIFWSLPITGMFIVLRAQVVRVILGSGNFDWNATKITAAALAILSVSVLAQSAILIFLRAYYSMGKTLKPFFITIGSLIVTVISSLYFINLLKTDFVEIAKSILRLNSVKDITVLALPMAYSIGQIFQLVFLVLLFGKFKNIVDKKLVVTFFQSLSGAIVGFLVAFLSLNFFARFFDLDTLFGIFMQGFIAGILGLICNFVFLVVIDNKEVKIAMKTLHTKFWKVKVVAPEVDEEI